MRWYDVTMPMHAGMTVWPGDAPFAIEPADRIGHGDSCNTSTLHMTTHTGTHCDAPWHFEEDGKRLDEVDPALFFGEALVLDLGGVDTIHAADLGDEPLPARLLFKTRNSGRPAEDPFDEDFVALEEDAAERIVDEGVRLVGIDGLSIAQWKRSGPTHHVLLENDVFVVEGLRLGNVPPGLCEFVVLPLALVGADGAPCRAFVGR